MRFKIKVFKMGVLLLIFLTFSSWSQTFEDLSHRVKEFVVVDDPLFALTHVRIIDGLGGPPKEDQTVIVCQGKIQAIGERTKISIPEGARVYEKPEYTLIPGLVGMHNHIFYPAGEAHYNTLEFSAPRLYLACGVTTIRTAGSLEPYTELNLKRAINMGKVLGPKIYVTSPYLEGPGAFTFQMNELADVEHGLRFVRYWASEGVDDFKAYTNIKKEVLEATLKEVHKLGMKMTAHLCSLGFREAAEIGIDNLEHGLLVDTEFFPEKKPDICPPYREVRDSLLSLDISSPSVQETIRTLVKNNVAITSTLPVFEISVPGRPPLQQRVLDAMAVETKVTYLSQRARLGERRDSTMEILLKKEMEFERAFVEAGGLLLTGPDPTGYGGVLPGFGDQRGIELLVEAGFSPEQAIKIATYNGALYLDQQAKIGSLTVGKQADMVLIKGNPSKNIAEIENVEIVFKDGIGYDSLRLIESVRGCVGVR